SQSVSTISRCTSLQAASMASSVTGRALVKAGLRSRTSKSSNCSRPASTLPLPAGPHAGSYRPLSCALETARLPERWINAPFRQRTGAATHCFPEVAARAAPHRPAPGSLHTVLALRRLEIPIDLQDRPDRRRRRGRPDGRGADRGAIGAGGAAALPRPSPLPGLLRGQTPCSEQSGSDPSPRTPAGEWARGLTPTPVTPDNRRILG